MNNKQSVKNLMPTGFDLSKRNHQALSWIFLNTTIYGHYENPIVITIKNNATFTKTETNDKSIRRKNKINS